MAANWLRVAGSHLVGVLTSVGVAAALWRQPAPAPLFAILIVALATSTATVGILAGRASLVGAIGAALVTPLLATVWTGDAERTLAAAAALLVPGLVVLDSTLRWHSTTRPATAAVVVASLVSAGAQIWFVNRFLLLDCLPLCRPNPFVIEHRPLLASFSSGVAALTVGVWAVVSFRRAGLRRRVVTIAGCVVSWVVLVYGNWVRVLSGSHTEHRLVLTLVGLGLVVIAADWIDHDVRQIVLRKRIRAATRMLTTGRQDCAVEAVLRGALRDPSVRIAYPVHDARFVDVDGAEVATTDRAGSEPIQLLRRDEAVAVLVTTADRHVASVLTPQLIMAIENEGLLVRSRALLGELQRSRQRLVSSADEARHRLERDLHDGAQQRLLAITMLLASEDGDADPNRRVALDEATTALSALRRIARGLYPVSLDRLGLVAALQSYLDEAPIAVELDLTTFTERPPPHMERVIYRIVHGFVAQSATHDATIVSVTIRSQPDSVIVELCHDGQSMGDTVDIEDRVGAVGGLWSMSKDDDRFVGEATLPCE